jgi:hypothetical protein
MTVAEAHAMPIAATLVVLAAVIVAVTAVAIGLGWFLRGLTRDCPTCAAMAEARARMAEVAGTKADPRRAADPLGGGGPPIALTPGTPPTLVQGAHRADRTRERTNRRR